VRVIHSKEIVHMNAKIALRWPLPWLLALAVASALSGLLGSAIRVDHPLVLRGVPAVYESEVPDPGFIVQQTDRPHLTP
jgi:hypothetical protein